VTIHRRPSSQFIVDGRDGDVPVGPASPGFGADFSRCIHRSGFLHALAIRRQSR
jgi:hypothetical protein